MPVRPAGLPVERCGTEIPRISKTRERRAGGCKLPLDAQIPVDEASVAGKNLRFEMSSPRVRAQKRGNDGIQNCTKTPCAALVATLFIPRVRRAQPSKRVFATRVHCTRLVKTLFTTAARDPRGVKRVFTAGARSTARSKAVLMAHARSAVEAKRASTSRVTLTRQEKRVFVRAVMVVQALCPAPEQLRSGRKDSAAISKR